MTRWNGSLIGVQKNTSLTDSTGVWNLRRQTLAKQNGVWPLDNSGIPQPNWSLDFSSGSPWSGGVEYTYTSSRTDGSATFINTSGQIQPIGLNLAPNTNNWSQNVTNFSGVTATANYAVSPSGETDATRAQVTTTGFVYKGAQGAVSSGTYTLSFYVKATSSSENIFVRVVGDNVTKTTQTITTTSVWTRYSFTIVTTTTAGLEIGIDHRTSVGGPGTTCDILLWGAQVVRGSETLPYRHCPGSTNEAIPRLTHDRNGSRLGLLIEEQRTNRAPNSVLLDTWFTTTVTRTTQTFIATPRGASVSASKLSGTSLVATSAWYFTEFSLASGDYTLSVYAKADGANFVFVFVADGTNDHGRYFDLSNGTMGNTVGTLVSSSIENAGNGWYRCVITWNNPSSATRYPALLPSTTNATGRASQSGTSPNGILVTAAQFEAGSTVSSWIETTSTTTVTRNEDKVHITKSKITNWSSPGAVCVHFYKPLQAGTLVATDNATAEKLGIQASSTTAARAFWSNGQTDTGIIGITGVVHKAIHYWNGTTSKFCINGTEVRTGTNNISNFNNTNFITLGAEATDSSGSPGTFSNYANCIINKVEFYAGELSNENLQQITDNNTMYPVQYLIIAGGGGGGTYVSGSNLGGGGGGAGGYLTGTATYLMRNTTYQVTIGAGGGRNTNGNDSSFNSLVSIGGGKGGYAASGSSGGSGGGGNNSGLGGTGTVGQGNDGGGSVGGWPYGGGGGGGAGSAGAAGTAAGAGAAGNGASSSITGTAITRAGGGGASAHNSSTVGGSGGGGNGGGWAQVSGNGTANTGSGGGGATHESINGGAGGSGVVILRMLTGNYTGTFTGTPSTSQIGEDTVIVFNSSGSYTA